MAIVIFLTIGMYIGPIRLLEVGPFNADYDSEGRLYEGYNNLDWNDEGEIKETMAANNNKDDDKEDP